ncbi:MAG: hypothetical protein GX660_12320, partial [Clostridiaceae bacterium]|nr:hypothetical protein [Clostridiaceae bacterium]
MHRYYIFILFICFVMVSGCGCTSTATSLEDMILAPEPDVNPVEGVWQIYNSLGSNFISYKNNNDSDWIGKTAEFSKDIIKVGDQFWSNPDYMVIRSDAREYFMYRYGILPDNFDIVENEIFVVSISSEGKYLYEFVKINDEDAVIVVQDNILLMKKLSNKADNLAAVMPDGSTIKNQKNESRENELIKSGVFIGIRSEKTPDGENYMKEYSYKTLWISAENRVLNEIIETDGIFLPRKNGFWKIGYGRRADKEMGDFLKVSSPYTLFQSKMKLNSSIIESDFESQKHDTSYKIIQYVSNDYVSLEVCAVENQDKVYTLSRYKILPVDNISNIKGMKISEIVGEDGVEILKEARTNALLSLSEKDIIEFDKVTAEENIALTRKMGHWFLKGRVNYFENGNLKNIDFILNMIPPKELVWYDTLCLSWNSIKSRVPGAIDAYTSPTKDIAIIVTNGKLSVYPIEEGILGVTPIGSIKLNEGDALVMAEWATG